MNIYDVSRQAGVSIATVSRVLNGSENVSKKTREKVLSVMDAMGYTPNVFARGLGLGSMHTIGIMCSDSSDMYLANAIYYLERELRQNGYNSILCCTGYDLNNKKSSLQLLLSKKVDGVILAGSKFVEMNEEDNDYIKEAAKQVPVLLVNGHLKGENIYSVLCDDYHAVYEAVSALLKEGRKQILYLFTSHSYSGSNKLRGYEDALKKFGIPVRQDYIYQCPKDMGAAKALLLGLKKEGLSFDAVVTSDDALAVGAVKYALTEHISIPDSLSVIGYNNSLLATCCEPELSSIDTKIEALCVKAVQLLMGAFEGRKNPGKTSISAQFIHRATTQF